ncbi:P-loop containing nucleoside triphosphate hydrolase protein [Epithele typhae]|uniref:P-loop containing nucleoside triphosphate hydrolase protein n=1 Tax=Epithele typhae TaxID=378194 RepID=UPI0020083C7C|nr:P-loop containing nucleoside triphosphate hydrolase protein [Epithele typhae]KAH9938976.1 P-loop containing nucleoside triphosphate hydrolase protein [Epithele typhae]
MLSEEDIAEEIRSALPGTEEIIVQYLSGYLLDLDDAAEDEDVLQVTRDILESAIGSSSSHAKREELEKLVSRLADVLKEPLTRREEKNRAGKGSGLVRLDKVMDLSKANNMSSTIAFSEGVDLESINKGKASRVDVKKLEKQEAKLRAKIEKRAKRTGNTLYEGSKLLDQHRKQEAYEEMFLKINPLDAAAASKNKSKDIHLTNIDVNFGSNRILSGASLTLPSGRRYGLIGRNGVEIVGDDTLAIDSVLKADVWRDTLLREEASLNARLAELEGEGDDKRFEDARDEAQSRLVERPGAGRGALAGLGFSEEDQQRQTRSFSGGWRMPCLLLLDEPSNHIDLNALAWLEDYLQTWPGTLLVVSHDRAFLDAVATDIVHMHSGRLDYYKGNFTQFYSTKSERDRNLRKEYETQMEYRKHLQAFIDRWRYNANRAAQAQSKIKILEKRVTFGYTPDKILLKGLNFDVGLDSRIAVIGPNGAGKSTLIKLLTGELKPMAATGYFAQHHVDNLIPSMSPVQFLAHKFPGKTEQEYRQHLGNFQISGMTGLQSIGTLSGGQKSRVAFAVLSLQRPHVLLLDEPTNHLDMEGLDALMNAIGAWNGGVILISHDERFITSVANELWVCADGTVMKFKGDVQAYKSLIVSNIKAKP